MAGGAKLPSVRLLLADESILNEDAAVGRSDGEGSSDLFGMWSEEGAVHGSGGGLRIRGSVQRDVEASIVAERRASADVDVL